MDNYYLRARYYDLGIGRFTQQDTFLGFEENPISLHKYIYANDDPSNTIDPSGLFGLSDILGAIRVQSILTTTAQGAGGAATRKLVWNGGCFIVKEMASAAILQSVSGIYIFEDVRVGKPYVGQSVNIKRRVNQHFKVPRTYMKNIAATLPISIQAGVKDKLGDLLDAVEQSIIDDLGGPKKGTANKRNQVNPANKKRSEVVKLMKKLKVCK